MAKINDININLSTLDDLSVENTSSPVLVNLSGCFGSTKVAGSNPVAPISYSSKSQLIPNSRKLLLHAKLTQKCASQTKDLFYFSNFL